MQNVSHADLLAMEDKLKNYTRNFGGGVKRCHNIIDMVITLAVCDSGIWQTVRKHFVLYVDQTLHAV